MNEGDKIHRKDETSGKLQRLKCKVIGRVAMGKFGLQMIIGMALFVLSTFSAWYEGSGIVENPFEWKYSTPFPHLMMQEITDGRNINQLDYFVYALKFRPLFPAMMIVSFIYILSVAGIVLTKMKSNWAICYWGSLGLILLFFSIIVSDSFTVGGSPFFWIPLITGLFFMAASFLQWVRKMQQQNTEITKVI
ncbi:YjdJ family protein [Ureibacillus thermosphaericus]|uniref:YjdJ family protein n=1 Tax=Ureibacillus thermosphaericus TaxID=51173 RepID=UPI001E3B8776|nr:YjdJ family protein [Ureibacillus thermosphaericus]